MGVSDGSREPVHIVIVDADPAQRRLVCAHLGSGLDAVEPVAVASREEAVAALKQRGHALVLADVETVGGTAALAALVGFSSGLIATSARGSVHSAVAAIRAGAVDYLPKPFGAAALLERVQAAVAQWNAGRATPAQPAAAPAVHRDAAGFEGLVGRSPAMLAVFEQIARIAPSRAPVFITGESGTGKELCAEALHARSGRDGRPFIAINCSAIPRDLMESEIFGHVRGAFTGASSASISKR